MTVRQHDRLAAGIARLALITVLGAAALGTAMATAATATPITVQNASFEDDVPNFNEFFLGTPTGWQLVDPGAIVGGNDVPGTLTATGSQFFNNGAPDGDHVGILFIGDEVGTSEFGLAQTLSAVLTAGTTYTLTVAVGNIQSGDATNGTPFDLSGFPGYRIELIAGNTLLASNGEGIDSTIPEGEFEDRQLVFTPDASHAALLGQALEIRLYNTNLTDPAHAGADLEVDFDDVRLDAALTTVPAPAGLALAGLGLAGLGFAARRRR